MYANLADLHISSMRFAEIISYPLVLCKPRLSASAPPLQLNFPLMHLGRKIPARTNLWGQ